MQNQAHRKPLRSPTNESMPQGASRAILNNCQNFTISNSTFTIQANGSDSDGSNFRCVRVGDLRLVKEVAKQNIIEYQEVRHKRIGVVTRRIPRVVGLREIYQARVHGSQEQFTAVVYQGSDFEKHRAHAERREELRHPFLVQLFGMTSGNNFKALIYHDGKYDAVPCHSEFHPIAGLLPLDEFRKMHQQSLLVKGFVENEVTKQFHAALTHWRGITGEWLVVQDSYGLWKQLAMGTVLWICLSTGQLCIEVNDNKEQDPTDIPQGYSGATILSRVHLTSDTNLEEKLLSHMPLDDIHSIFSAAGRVYQVDIADAGTVLLGSLSWLTSSHALFNPFSEISLSDSLRLQDVNAEGWEYVHTQAGSSFLNDFVILPNGWTRVGLEDLSILEECHFRQTKYVGEALLNIFKYWLSQANHVMDTSGMDADEYFIIINLVLRFSISFDLDPFTLQGTFMADVPRDDIYLFLFPPNIDNSGGDLAVHLPPASDTYYWSFDPDGIERLPQEALEELALPQVNFRAQVTGSQWSKEVYESITKFHCAKGFDPTSRDVAIKLGYPLVDVDRLINLIYCDAIVEVDAVEVQEA